MSASSLSLVIPPPPPSLTSNVTHQQPTQAVAESVDVPLLPTTSASVEPLQSLPAAVTTLVQASAPTAGPSSSMIF